MDSLLNSIGLLCIAINNSNERVGRTKLQKMVYLVDKYLDWNIDSFRLHFYGPYSSSIANILKTIKEDNLVEEKLEIFGPYEYKLLDRGKKFMDVFEKNLSNKYKSKLNSTKEIFADISKWDKSELELVATIDFVNHNSIIKDENEIINKVSTIKNKDIDVVTTAYKKWIEWKQKNNFS